MWLDKLTDQQNQELLADYKAGMNLKIMSEKYRVWRSTIHRKVKDAGLPVRQRGMPRQLGPSTNTNNPWARDGMRARRQDKDYTLNASLKQHYGIDLAIYDQMAEAQGGVCDICKQPPAEGKRLDVDHDHTKTKGQPGFLGRLLCPACNKGLGNFKDNPALLLAAVEYLQKYRTPNVPRSGPPRHTPRPPAADWKNES